MEENISLIIDIILELKDVNYYENLSRDFSY